MKIKIKNIENKLGKKIKRNFKSLGVDTAQTTGIIFLTTDNEYIYIENLVLGFKTKNKKEIYSSMVKTFEKLFQNENLAIIEEVFVGFSRAGSVELSKYGAFAISECIKKDISYETISAVSARSKFKINTKKCGKGKSKLAVANFVKELNIDLTDNNLVDAFILALLGIIEDMDFRSQKEISKTKKKKKLSKKTKKKNKK